MLLKLTETLREAHTGKFVSKPVLIETAAIAHIKTFDNGGTVIFFSGETGMIHVRETLEAILEQSLTPALMRTA